MSTVNEEIVTGRKFRRLIDEATKLWQRISIWSKASDVEFDDGETAETKMGAIKGITTDLNTTETGYAADMTALAQLYSEISDIGYKNVEPVPGIVFDTQQCFSIGNLVVLQIKINITSKIPVKNTSKIAKVPDEWVPSLSTGWIAGSSALVSYNPADHGIPCFAGVDTDGYLRLANDQAADMYGASISAMYLV